jgi:hypothetical protein
MVGVQEKAMFDGILLQYTLTCKTRKHKGLDKQDGRNSMEYKS